VVLGIEPADAPEAVAAVLRAYGVDSAPRYAYRGTAGDRNIHQMSGRVV